jgi:hypothetical protein
MFYYLRLLLGIRSQSVIKRSDKIKINNCALEVLTAAGSGLLRIVCTSETSVNVCQTTRRKTPEDRHQQSKCGLDRTFKCYFALIIVNDVSGDTLIVLNVCSISIIPDRFSVLILQYVFSLLFVVCIITNSNVSYVV